MPFRAQRQHHRRPLSARCMCIFLLCALVVHPVVAAPDTPEQRLADAIDIYQHGGYLEAAALLTRLLYPLKLTDRNEIVKAKVYLGLCYYVLGRKDEAEEEFRGVFKIDPRYKPDPLYIPPEIITFIQKLRPDPATARSPLLGLGEKPVEPDLQRLRVSPLSFLPLGIPQLYHGDTRRGIAFGSTQLGLLAINIGSYWYLRINNDETGTGNTETYPYLVAARAVNISSFSLLAAAIAFGIGDAVYRYRKEPPPLTFHLELAPGPGTVMGLGVQGRF